MAGQGCPRRSSARARERPPGGWPSFARAAVALCCALLLVPSIAQAADLDVRLRLAWGGGEARSWQGAIRLSSGTLSEPQPLGLEADTPGSMHLVEETRLIVFPRTPRTYDGVDLRVQAPDDAKLIIELTAEGVEPLDPIELPLASVLKGLQQADLDDAKNRLLAQRSPGDALRVTLARDSLVFAPGEKLELDVQANPFDLSAGSTYELVATLVPARTDEEITSQTYELKADPAGRTEPLALALPQPPGEGVYDLKLALYPKRLTSAIVRPKPKAERKVQVVVVATTRPTDRDESWKTVYELDPANPTWWERMARMPSLRRLPTLGPQQLTSGSTKKRNVLGLPWIELPKSGWQAYPLALESPGQPHVLEVEYVSDHEQTLGISLVEPNAAGRVQPLGLDSGFQVLPAAPGHDPQIKRHRLLFWPRTKSPWVLLTNRRSDAPALVGKINVLAGPIEPPALKIPPAATAGRMLTAYFDRPLLAENFSATELLDPAAGRTFDDWQTFYEAGERMVATLRHGGYNAVVLSVVHDGGALYPSELLGATPKYDTGTYFESGQDPLRKDVLELLFRLCDRAGILVIPAVQFAAPLPELEVLRLAEGEEAIGLEPIGPDGLSWIASHPERRGTGAYYNPLDDRVQQALQRVVAELAERYGEHAAFGGVAVQWTADSYAVLPDKAYSYDDATIARFESETSTNIPLPANASPLAARHQFLRGPGAKAWLDWRAERLAAMYGQMQATLIEHRKNARLFLLPADLLGSRQVQEAMRPTLPPVEAADDLLASLGIDPQRLREIPGVVLPRPYREAAGATASHQSLVGHWNQSAELDALFSQGGSAATVHFHEPAPLLPLPAFDKVSPFGADKTHTLLLAQISPADAANRQRLVHSLALLDAPLLIDGGVMLPLGQEEALAPLVKVFRRLPAERFSTAAPQGRSGEKPNSDDPTADAVGRGIVVRSLSRGNKTWFYVVNDTPWPANVEIDFAGNEMMRVLSYGEERKTTLDEIDGGVSWTVTLEPHDLAGGEINSPHVRVTDYRATFGGDPARWLQQQIRSNQLRTNELRRPQPLAVLANPSFAAAAGQRPIPGWEQGSVPPGDAGGTIEIDDTLGREDTHSLHLVSRPGAGGRAAPILWVRSDPFKLPETGRLTLVAWVRVADPRRQPQLRLAVEGARGGRVQYQYGQIGLDNSRRPTPNPLSTEWARFTIPLTNLPLDGGGQGANEVRVGFDLMGEGEVWIDDVEVHGLMFSDTERDALLKSGFAAQVELTGGRLAECQRFVTGYWPSFLRRHVPLPEPRADAAFAPPKGKPNDAPAARTASPTTWDKMRSWIPSPPSFWR